MKVILHSGLDKTGSTAIQSHMCLNQQWLQNRGVYIPKTGLTGWGHRKLFKQEGEIDYSELVEELKKLQSEGAEIVFLSCEGINFFTIEKLKKIKDGLSVFDVVILMYLREQSEIVQSGFLQDLKSGSRKVSILSLQGNSRLLCPSNRNYRLLLEKFENVFGLDALDIRIFESNTLKEKNIVIDFLDALGLSQDADFILAQNQQNLSIDLPSAQLLNILDSLYPNHPGRTNIVDALVADVALSGNKGKYFLRREDCLMIKENYEKSNTYVAQRYLKNKDCSPALFSYKNQTHNTIDTDILQQLVSEKFQVLEKIHKFPLWDGGTLQGVDSGKLAFYGEGWYETESWGVWTQGKKSYIRYRLLEEYIGVFHQKMRLKIEGKYFSGNSETKVIINGKIHKQLPLTAASIEIPLNELGDYRTVEIELFHNSSVSPLALGLGEDDREIAFGLHSISYCTL